MRTGSGERSEGAREAAVTRGDRSADGRSSPASWRSTIVNLALYEAGWFGCVLGAAAGRPVLALSAALLSAVVHLALAAERSREAALMASAGMLGLLADSATVRLDVLEFSAPLGPEGVAPVWVVGMWVQFAMVFRFCLAWLGGRYWLSALLGAVGGPLSFMAGARLGAVEILSPTPRSLVILGAIWAISLTLLVALADRLGKEVGRYRFDR